MIGVVNEALTEATFLESAPVPITGDTECHLWLALPWSRGAGSGHGVDWADRRSAAAMRGASLLLLLLSPVIAAHV